jgi:hypothetical protein
MALRLGRATVDGFARRRSFDEVERFVFFIGYPHSGSTMVGALLDAHPEMVISHEADVLRYVKPGVTRSQVFALILDGDRRFEALGRQWMGIDYTFPGTAQGHYDRLRVIGDKSAGQAARQLAPHPRVLDRLRSVVGVPIRVLHITRNPFDNAASIARSRRKPLSFGVNQYRNFSQCVEEVRPNLGPEELMELTYESVTSDPSGQLRALCDFLGVPAHDSFLEACAAAVRPRESRSRSRDAMTWSPELRREVEGLIASRPTLRDYTFSN